MADRNGTSRAYFYPRPPWGGRLANDLQHRMQDIFLSTPSVGRATRKRLATSYAGYISIHALRGEGDRTSTGSAPRGGYFYPRPPWGGRPHLHRIRAAGRVFLSTPSVGRATVSHRLPPYTLENFYPRPPWGGRLLPICFCQAQGLFLSTPSVGRATKLSSVVSPCFAISIHALRGEGDIVRNTGKRFEYLISIHALRGEGDDVAVGGVGVLPGFLSTPSVGRATFVANGAPCAHVISIHALRGEGDPILFDNKILFLCYFYPRPPWGGRLGVVGFEAGQNLFLSTPSVGRATAPRP